MISLGNLVLVTFESVIFTKGKLNNFGRWWPVRRVDSLDSKCHKFNAGR